MSRPLRLLSLLAALQGRRHTTTQALAEELAVSRRTILRDVQALVDAGFPVLTERGRYGGITLLPGGQVDLSRLTTSEEDVFRTVGLDLDRARQLGEEAAARSAGGKLSARRRSPAPAITLPLSLAEVVVVDNRAWFAAAEPPDVAGLVRDLRRGHRMRLRYRRSGAPTSRSLVVDPYGLLLRADRWYLVGDVEGRPRLFALTRLESWEVLDEPRELRDGATLAGVADALGRSLESLHAVTVTLLLDADRIDIARRILGSRLLTVTHHSDGRLRLTVGYDQLDGVRHLLQFSDHFEVVDPPEARCLVRALALKISQAHL